MIMSAGHPVNSQKEIKKIFFSIKPFFAWIYVIFLLLEVCKGSFSPSSNILHTKRPEKKEPGRYFCESIYRAKRRKGKYFRH